MEIKFGTKRKSIAISRLTEEQKKAVENASGKLYISGIFRSRFASDNYIIYITSDDGVIDFDIKYTTRNLQLVQQLLKSNEFRISAIDFKNNIISTKNDDKLVVQKVPGGYRIIKDDFKLNISDEEIPF